MHPIRKRGGHSFSFRPLFDRSKNAKRLSAFLGSTNDGRYDILVCGHTEPKSPLYPPDGAMLLLRECLTCERLACEAVSP